MRLGPRRIRLVIAATGVATLAACASADLRPGVVRHETLKQIRDKFHGPEVSVRASNVYQRNARLIAPVVSLGDSAFVLVGDIGDDGTLRILYPENPGDSNLVRTGKLKLPAFSPRVTIPLFSTSRTPGTRPVVLAAGNVFVIASSKPLRTAQLAEDGRWSLFDVYYSNHVNDPQAAIIDLAASVAADVGDVQIAYDYYGKMTALSRGATSSALAPGSIQRRRRPPG